MKIKDIMTTDVRSCSPGTSLAEAGALMLDADCGILPVVDEGKLVGIVTDRDMFIALATRNARATQLRVSDVARKTVFTCGPDDEVHAALETMKGHRVRRLPVAGFADSLIGIVSMNDLVLAAGTKKPVRNEEVVETFQEICAHHHPVPHVAVA